MIFTSRRQASKRSKRRHSARDGLSAVDRVLVPLATGQWLLLPAAVFTEALAAARSSMPAVQPRAADAESTVEQLKDSRGMAELLGCNSTLVEQMAKDGRVPSVRIGKLLRFEPARVLAALRSSRGDR